MKIQGWILGCLLLMTGAAWGQNEPPRFQEAMAKMKAERVSFLTDKLQLTVEEAEKFWPLYNEYLSKREEMMWGKREKMPRNFDPSQLTEEELNKMLNDILDQEVKLAQLKKDYFEKMKGVLPVRKVLTLHRVEQEFMNHMLNQFRENRKPGDGPKGGGHDGF
jgi:Spy/CpxP family protein refolding chaperone